MYLFMYYICLVTLILMSMYNVHAIQIAMLGLLFQRMFDIGFHRFLSDPMIYIITFLISLHVLLCLTDYHRNALINGVFSYDKIMRGDYHRIVTSVLLHDNIVHLLSNIAGLVIIGKIRCVGNLNEYFTILLIIICNSAVHMLICFLINDRSYVVGFSGVVFALDVLRYYTLDKEIVKNIIIRLLIAQVSASNVSFIGHVSGIICGFLLFSYRGI